MKTGEILKELRIEADLTQKDLAKLLGIGQSTIAGYERGEREATAYILSLYAAHFRVSVDYLLGREEDWHTDISAPPLPEYTKDERNLVEAYRDLNPALQNLLWDMIHTWEKKDASKETSKKKA